MPQSMVPVNLLPFNRIANIDDVKDDKSILPWKILSDKSKISKSLKSSNIFQSTVP